MRFIYAFDQDGRELLLRLGYHLITEDTVSGVYVFENRSDMTFSYRSANFVLSDRLTF